MISATSSLLQQVAAQQATAAYLSQLSVQCGGAPLVLQELEQLAENVGLKHLLWTMQQDMAATTAAWLQGQLFDFDVADMTAQVSVYPICVGTHLATSADAKGLLVYRALTQDTS